MFYNVIDSFYGYVNALAILYENLNTYMRVWV